MIGSFLADLLYQGFGMGAWYLVFMIVGPLMSLLPFAKLEPRDRNPWILHLTLIFNISALLASYIGESRFFEGQIAAGGFIGATLVGGLMETLNSGGLQLVLWTTFLIQLVLLTRMSVKDILSWPAQRLRVGRWPGFVGQKLKKGWREWLTSLRREFAERSKVALARKLSRAKEIVAETASASAAKGLATDPAVEDPTGRFLPLLAEPSLVAEPSLALRGGFLPIETSTSMDPTPGARKRIVKPVATPKRVAQWDMPKIELLEDPPLTRLRLDEKEIRRKADILLDKLKQFGVNGAIVGARPGPAVTLYEFKPNADVKISKVTELADDLALALSSESLRIIAPIPGRDVVGIETSNSQRETVYLKDLLAENDFWSEDFRLPLALGRQANGDPRIVDLRKMPHLLVAGTTGSGKSVFTVSAITGLLLKHSPKTLRLILVDPKQVDLAVFNDVPHLIAPPVTDPKKAVGILRWAVREMEKRYRSMKKFAARGLEGFNQSVEKLSSEDLEKHQLELEGAGPQEDYYYQPLPYIVIVCEEFGDLMAVDKQNVEQNVVRLAQMARACGIHLMLAMQSPRKEVVTGLIKTNIPGRISFKVASKMDSRIILDEMGAERLLAQGDMLFLSPGFAKPVRHHGPFLKEAEIQGVAKFWCDQAPPDFDALALKIVEGRDSSGESSGAGAESALGFDEDEFDEKYDEILAWTADLKEVSASLIQRRFRLGYPRAARLIELFEKEGVVGPANGSKPRAVLVNSHREL